MSGNMQVYVNIRVCVCVLRTNLESEAVDIRPGKIIQQTLLPFHLLKKNTLRS